MGWGGGGHHLQVEEDTGLPYCLSAGLQFRLLCHDLLSCTSGEKGVSLCSHFIRDCVLLCKKTKQNTEMLEGWGYIVLNRHTRELIHGPLWICILRALLTVCQSLPNPHVRSTVFSSFCTKLKKAKADKSFFCGSPQTSKPKTQNTSKTTSSTSPRLPMAYTVLTSVFFTHSIISIF